jgi:vitamin B12 transporter
MKKNLFLVAAVIFSSTLQAQQTTDSAQQLNEVIVTANKFPQKQAETGRVLSVITQQQLQRSAGKSLTEMINQQVGITINGANNNLGSNQTVYVRGASAGNTLILLDGVPQNDAAGINSEFDLNTYNADQIERIEILKGTQSTLYGSDAVAGVINIITKKGGSKNPGVNINMAAGSYGTFRGSINLRGTTEEGGDYFVGYSKVHSDGFSTAYDSTGTGNFDRDGFKQDVLQAGFGFRPNTKLYGKIYGKYNVNRADIDAGAFTDDKDYTFTNRNIVIGTSLQYQWGKTKLFLNLNSNWFSRVFFLSKRGLYRQIAVCRVVCQQGYYKKYKHRCRCRLPGKCQRPKLCVNQPFWAIQFKSVRCRYHQNKAVQCVCFLAGERTWRFLCRAGWQVQSPFGIW